MSRGTGPLDSWMMAGRSLALCVDGPALTQKCFCWCWWLMVVGGWVRTVGVGVGRCMLRGPGPGEERNLRTWGLEVGARPTMRLHLFVCPREEICQMSTTMRPPVRVSGEPGFTPP
ncbi:hypothetical protein OF83DRAFT_1127876 [Amylostereum chailletii]|nr:hypothetical protein OF83DRAFT_1127876 [Amylostereum chailletii]